jgi:GMP synthase-like glutamine amidotransferase
VRILIVDNNIDRDCWGAGDLVRYAVAAPGATVFVRRGPAGDLPEDVSRYDRIIVSGSRTSCLDAAPWTGRLDELIRRAVDRSKPLLGVCYGHQALVRALGGREAVRRGKTPEFGWTRIERVERSPLFEGLPDAFYSFSSHFEEAARLPQGTRLLARSEDCAIQACAVDGKPAYGIQFHPEKDLADGEKTLAERRKKGEPRVLLNADRGRELYDPKVAETLFRNFLAAS